MWIVLFRGHLRGHSNERSYGGCSALTLKLCRRRVPKRFTFADASFRLLHGAFREPDLDCLLALNMRSPTVDTRVYKDNMSLATAPLPYTHIPPHHVRHRVRHRSATVRPPEQETSTACYLLRPLVSVLPAPMRTATKRLLLMLVLVASRRLNASSNPPRANARPAPRHVSPASIATASSTLRRGLVCSRGPPRPSATPRRSIIARPSYLLSAHRVPRAAALPAPTPPQAAYPQQRPPIAHIHPRTTRIWT